MNDWNTEVAGQYELNVESMRKGRGAWIFETDRGLKLRVRSDDSLVALL